MKKIRTIIAITTLAFSSNFYAQTNLKQTCAVLDIDIVGSTTLTPSTAGNLTRRELSNLGIYEVAYHQDIEDVIKKNKINLAECYSISCLIEAGKSINTDKVLSGYIERAAGNIIISFREIEVKTGNITRSKSKEYQDLPEQIKNMVILTLKEMYDYTGTMQEQETDKEMIKLLAQDMSRDSYINNNGNKRLNLSGTRMGFVTILGDNKDILKAPEAEGGFDASPTMFQFGYQFETQYLNSGRLQGLFEFIPSVTGLEQGLFLPSMTILHGIRDNKTGIEFAFGPTVGLIKKVNGYYDDGVWHLQKEWNDTANANPNPIISRLDSRGEITLNPGFVIAAGFSIKSGSLNVPVNAFAVMQKKAFRVGISFGINSKGNN